MCRICACKRTINALVLLAGYVILIYLVYLPATVLTAAPCSSTYYCSTYLIYEYEY